jgi:hypothetical protein
MKLVVFIVCLLAFDGFRLAGTTAVPAEYCFNSEETKLHDLMMAYRKEKGLDPIPVSFKLSKVAKLHVADLIDHYRVELYPICNPHSWSSKGPWSYCCYTEDNRHAKCMLAKPKEITGYKSSGYEIVYYRSGSATAQQSLESWKSSVAHHALIINEGPWAKIKWRAIGIAIDSTYACVWFGAERDKSDFKICE